MQTVDNQTRSGRRWAIIGQIVLVCLMLAVMVGGFEWALYSFYHH